MACEDVLVPLPSEAEEGAVRPEEAHGYAIGNKPVDDHEDDRHVEERQNRGEDHDGNHRALHFAAPSPAVKSLAVCSSRRWRSRMSCRLFHHIERPIGMRTLTAITVASADACVELLGRRVDRHDRKREERVHRHEHNRRLRVEYRRMFGTDRKKVVARLQPAVGMEHRLPREHTHDETRPERKHYRTRDDRTPARVHASNRIGARHGKHDRPDRHLDGYLDSVPDDRGVVGIDELAPGGKRPLPDAAGDVVPVEGESEDDNSRHREKEREPEERRRSYEPFGPACAKRTVHCCASTM